MRAPQKKRPPRRRTHSGDVATNPFAIAKRRLSPKAQPTEIIAEDDLDFDETPVQRTVRRQRAEDVFKRPAKKTSRDMRKRRRTMEHKDEKESEPQGREAREAREARELPPSTITRYFQRPTRDEGSCSSLPKNSLSQLSFVGDDDLASQSQTDDSWMKRGRITNDNSWSNSNFSFMGGTRGGGSGNQVPPLLSFLPSQSSQLSGYMTPCEQTIHQRTGSELKDQLFLDRLEPIKKASRPSLTSADCEGPESIPASDLAFPPDNCFLPDDERLLEENRKKVRGMVANTRFMREFEVIRELGKGSFGTVYHARSRCDGCPYAVKKVTFGRSGVSRTSALREGFIMAALARLGCCRFLVRFHAMWECTESAFYVTEFCDHGSLRARVGQPFVEQDLLKVAFHVAQALEFLHAHHFVHLDVKPDNVLVSRAGVFKLADFGLCIQVDLQNSTDLRGEGLSNGFHGQRSNGEGGGSGDGGDVATTDAHGVEGSAGAVGISRRQRRKRGVVREMSSLSLEDSESGGAERSNSGHQRQDGEGLRKRSEVMGRTSDPSDVQEGDRRYLSRELMEGKHRMRELDKCDLFALGMTLYELLCGRALPDGGWEWQRLRQGELPALDAVRDDVLRRVVRKTLCPVPSDRPFSREVVSYLRRFQDEEVRALHRALDQAKQQIEAAPHRNSASGRTFSEFSEDEKSPFGNRMLVEESTSGDLSTASPFDFHQSPHRRERYARLESRSQLSETSTLCRTALDTDSEWSVSQTETANAPPLPTRGLAIPPHGGSHKKRRVKSRPEGHDTGVSKVWLQVHDWALPSVAHPVRLRDLMQSEIRRRVQCETRLDFRRFFVVRFPSTVDPFVDFALFNRFWEWFKRACGILRDTRDLWDRPNASSGNGKRPKKKSKAPKKPGAWMQKLGHKSGKVKRREKENAMARAGAPRGVALELLMTKKRARKLAAKCDRGCFVLVLSAETSCLDCHVRSLRDGRVRVEQIERTKEHRYRASWTKTAMPLAEVLSARADLKYAILSNLNDQTPVICRKEAVF